MIFEWDKNKNKANQSKHGISFEEATLIFKNTILTTIDNRADYGEEREISIGLIGEQVVVVVVHTDRGNTTRIISARLANKTERKAYDDYYKKIT